MTNDRAWATIRDEIRAWLAGAGYDADQILPPGTGATPEILRITFEDDLDLDSLDVAGITERIESAAGIRIPISAEIAWTTIEDLVNCVQQYAS